MFLSSYISVNYPSPLYFHYSMPLYVVAKTAILIYLASYTGWLWAIAETANRELDPPFKTSTRLMAVALVYIAFYVIGTHILFPHRPGPDQGIRIFGQFLSLIAMLYAMEFAVKRLATLEQKQQVSFPAYIGSFFLIFFFPIGVWFIQPRVNRLLGNNR